VSGRKAIETMLRENLRFRKLSKDIVEIEQVIAQKRAKGSSQHDVTSWKREIKELNQKHMALQSEVPSLFQHLFLT
jgi:hypothetical protein